MSKKLLNFLQHELTGDQARELEDLGYSEIVHLRDFSPELWASVSQTPGSEKEIQALSGRLQALVLSPYRQIARPFDAVLLPGGSPALMFHFAYWLGAARLEMDGYHDMANPVYNTPPKFLFAHSERQSIDTPQPDGTVRKVAVFQHIKFLSF